MQSDIKKGTCISLLHHQREMYPPQADIFVRKMGCDRTEAPFDRGGEESRGEISGAYSFRKRKSLLCAFSRIHATKTLGTTGCRSPGHENLPGFAFSLLFPRAWPALTSFAAPGSIFKCAHCRAFVFLASSVFSSEIAPDVLPKPVS